MYDTRVLRNDFTLGTFMLVLTVGCNVLTGSIGAALSIGAMLMAMVYAIGPVSGAHLNPAVTVAVVAVVVVMMVVVMMVAVVAFI